MWIPIAIKKMQTRAKYMMEWTSMDTPLVWKLPNSTILLLPGIWMSNPGVKRMKSTTDTKTGPQSAIFSSIFPSHTLVGCLMIPFSECNVHMGLGKGKVRLVEKTRNWWLGRQKFLPTKGEKAKVTKSSASHSNFTTHTCTHTTNCSWHVYK